MDSVTSCCPQCNLVTCAEERKSWSVESPWAACLHSLHYSLCISEFKNPRLRVQGLFPAPTPAVEQQWVVFQQERPFKGDTSKLLIVVCAGCRQVLLPVYVKASCFGLVFSPKSEWRLEVSLENWGPWLKTQKEFRMPTACQEHVICSKECRPRLWVEMGGQKTNRQTEKALHIQKGVREWEQWKLFSQVCYPSSEVQGLWHWMDKAQLHRKPWRPFSRKPATHPLTPRLSPCVTFQKPRSFGHASQGHVLKQPWSSKSSTILTKGYCHPKAPKFLNLSQWSRLSLQKRRVSTYFLLRALLVKTWPSVVVTLKHAEQRATL